MFGIDSSELAVVAILAMIFIGPKDLPKVMRTLGRFAGKARATSRHFKSGVKAMLREAELEELRRHVAEHTAQTQPHLGTAAEEEAS